MTGHRRLVAVFYGIYTFLYNYKTARWAWKNIALSEGLCAVFYAVFYAVCSQCIVLLFFSLFYCHSTVHQSVPRSQNFLHFLTWSWTIVSSLSELLNNILSLDIDNFFICFQLSLSSIHFQGMFENQEITKKIKNFKYPNTLPMLLKACIGCSFSNWSKNEWITIIKAGNTTIGIIQTEL